jgi:hypothetical protein
MTGARAGLLLLALLLVGSRGGSLAAQPALVAGPLLVLDWNAGGTEQGAQFGSAAGAGDFNGDGYPDLVIGAPKLSHDAYRSGAVLVYYGSAQGWASQASQTLSLAQTGARFGAAVAVADLNGDGFADLVVGAPEYHNGLTRSGAVFVYYGSAAGLDSEPGWQKVNEQASSQLGLSVAAGDLNGDGFDDLVAGAPWYSLAEGSRGAVFVHFGSAGGPAASDDWAGAVEGDASLFGHAVAVAGDLNGNGLADLAVGAPQYLVAGEKAGAVFVYYGSMEGLPPLAAWTAPGAQSGDRFGQAVAGAGDVDGDGYADLLVGASQASNEYEREGAAYLYRGSAGGLKTAASWLAYGGKVGTGWGMALAGAGDLDGDGFADVVVGAPYFTDDQPAEGGVFVFRGTTAGLQTQAAWVAWGNKAETEFGSALALIADPAGAGLPQLLVGAPTYRKEEVILGRAFVYHASPAGTLPNLLYLPFITNS